LLGQEVAQVVGIVATIGNQTPYRTASLQQGSGDADVVDVAGGQQQDTWPALTVGQRMELARLAAARLAERLEVCPPLWNGPPLSSTMIG
jgi:hypothetical protein